MINYEEIEPYLLDYLQGRADEGMEYRIKAYIQQNPDFENELNDLRETADFLESSPLEEPDPSLKMGFYAMLKEYQIAENQSITNKARVWWDFIYSKVFIRSLSWAGVVLLIFVSGYYTSFYLNQTGSQLEQISLQKENPTLTKPEANKNDLQAVPEAEEDEKSTENKIDDNQTQLADSQINKSKTEPLAYVGGEPITNLPEVVDTDKLSKEVADAVMMERMVKPDIPTSASSSPITSTGASITNDLTVMNATEDRLQEIYQLLEPNGLDQFSNNQGLATNKLLQLLKQDASPNVRLAAADILENYIQDEKIKDELSQLLDNEQVPALQSATMDLLVKYQIKSGVTSIQKLFNRADTHPMIREQAGLALESM
jgi:hypothetical protein